MEDKIDSMEIVSKIMRLHRLLKMNKMESVRGKNGMDFSRGRGRILVVLNIVGEISPGDLCVILGIRSQSLNESVKKLEEAGYVTRRQDEKDKRRALISITESGRQNVPDIPGGMDEVFSCLSEKEKSDFSEYLDRIISSLARHLDLPESEDEQLEAMRQRMGEERFGRMMKMRGTDHRRGHDEFHHHRGNGMNGEFDS